MGGNETQKSLDIEARHLWDLVSLKGLSREQKKRYAAINAQKIPLDIKVAFFAFSLWEEDPNREATRFLRVSQQQYQAYLDRIVKDPELTNMYETLLPPFEEGDIDLTLQVALPSERTHDKIEDQKPVVFPVSQPLDILSASYDPEYDDEIRAARKMGEELGLHGVRGFTSAILNVLSKRNPRANQVFLYTFSITSAAVTLGFFQPDHEKEFIKLRENLTDSETELLTEQQKVTMTFLTSTINRMRRTKNRLP